MFNGTHGRPTNSPQNFCKTVRNKITILARKMSYGAPVSPDNANTTTNNDNSNTSNRNNE